VSKAKIRRLYENDANGIIDEDLIEEVASLLYLRILSILQVKEAKEGRVKCPRCAERGAETVIPRDGGREMTLVCPVCGWRMTWAEYQKTYKRKQLHHGGALPAFENYLRQYDAAKTPRERLLAIDRVIHEFHYWLVQEGMKVPTRAAAVNLIEGRLTDVVLFLDELTYGDRGEPELRASHEAWRDRLKLTFFGKAREEDE
jgi:hypothetical protein